MKRKPVTITITVLSGLHQGATQDLSPGAVRIGGGAGADIVLADAGLAPAHLELDLSSGWAVFHALDTGVMIDGIGSLESGNVVRAALPAAFSLAGVRLSCGADRSATIAWRVSQAWRDLGTWQGAWAWPRGRALAFPALAVLSIAGLVFIRAAPTPAMASVQRVAAAVPANPAPMVKSAREAGPRSPEPHLPELHKTFSPLDPAKSAAMLQADLAKAGLVGIQITTQGSMVVASGTIAPTDAARWQAVREDFDRGTGGQSPLRNDVQARADRAVTLSVDSVWTGDFPNIVIAGSKYLEGSVLPNGWTLERIGNNRLDLRRGDQRVGVTF